MRTAINPDDVYDSTRYGFSQAVAVRGGSTVHVSGQVGWDAAERLAGTDLATQAGAAVDNLERVLLAAGGALGDTVALRIYVVEAAAGDLAPIGEVLRERFPTSPPAATWLVVSGLAGDGLLVEIEATATVGG